MKPLTDKQTTGVSLRPVILALLSFIAGLPANQAFACATCLAGDPTVTTMGTEKPYGGRLRGSVEWLARGETMGQAGISEHKIDEERLTLSVSYAPNEKWILAMSVPLVNKEVLRFDLSHESGSGVGDTDLTARWYLSHSRKHLWGMQFGVRIPTSSEQTSGGETIDFDAQPGAGATIPNLGLWYGYYRAPVFLYSSAVYMHAIDTGYQGYEAGDGLLLTGLAQYGFWDNKLALSFSLDGRWKEQDLFFGEPDEDSGGVLVMATPGISWTPVTDLIFNASYQIPAIENLNGRQEEDPIIRIGVTYDF